MIVDVHCLLVCFRSAPWRVGLYFRSLFQGGSGAFDMLLWTAFIFSLVSEGGFDSSVMGYLSDFKIWDLRFDKFVFGMHVCMAVVMHFYFSTWLSSVTTRFRISILFFHLN